VETKTTDKTADSKPSWGQRLWRDWIKPVLLVLLVVGAVRSAVADWNDVPTGSMKPTILEGDRIFVSKLAYDMKVPFVGWQIVQWGDPKSGDIVVFFSPADGVRMVKRVVAVPGDQVEVRNKQLLINGNVATYEPLDPQLVNEMQLHEMREHVLAAETIGEKTHPVMILPGQSETSFFGPVTVPADHYFVMGDNRDNSFDSRWFGFVSRHRIVGRATSVVISLDTKDSYLPRWDRFFSKLD